nr:unnamed protein product [Callosobruchus analis]
MRDSLTNPVHVYEGDDALITCVVRDIGTNTVMWKKEDRERHSTRVLTAGENRVTADRRYGVLHDSEITESDESAELPSGGDVWVLVIKNAKPTDSGVYVCEVNSSPTVRSFHKLSVISKTMSPPNTTFDPTTSSEDRQLSSRNHNYTDCCISKNVSSSCLGFCNIHSILEGTTGQDPEQCELDFPKIVHCMADGRNHVPCCIQERVPDICQDVCRGEYTAITDNIKTHFSCSTYTEQTLACIVEGIELLPSPPEYIEVDALTESTLRVEWSPPASNADTVSEYLVNVTSLRSFDDRLIDLDENPVITNGSTSTKYVVTVKVPGAKSSTVVNDLSPFTMYEISVTASNKHGSSLPSYTVRSLTLAPGTSKPTSGVPSAPPNLPDVRQCCQRRGVSHKTCLSKLCDPKDAAAAEITDLMICAPWAADTFGCLANDVDHTPCCKERGLPELCLQLCTGNVSSIDFNYFKCLRYMGEYTNCLMQGYGVLPTAPTRLRVTNIDTEFAVLQWEAPKRLDDTVLYYNVHVRTVEVEGDDEEYKVRQKVKSPYVLAGLDSETDYEVYVEAVNAHGVGLPSSRITFRTASKLIEEKIEEAETSVYNVTGCCIEAQVKSVCLPICSYNAKMSEIKLLAGVCGAEFHKILRCGAGGRNHLSCCNRRGVPSGCLSICNGVIVDSLISTATSCVSYIGNIAQCFEEGTGFLPGPVSGLHAVVVDEHSILLEWNAPENSTSVTDYVVHYQKVDNTSMHETLLRLDNQLNSSSTTMTITGLEENKLYHIFVVARNENGTSLPSSILEINLVKSDKNKWVNGVTSPPHSLAVASHSATWVTITWQPPEFSHPSEIITYRLYHKSTTEDQFHVKNLTLTTYMISGLSPNTQYIVYVQAVTSKGDSMPSETLIAWTDPAYPAFVEPPTVHPINLVIEGSSMTILCIAMGTPMPTISLYISGRLVRQETTRHMVTVINNVTKDMDQISCYADNGYGTPMQASRKITISHGPHIQANGITMATLGDSVTLECKVEAQPEPKMIFWRNHEDRTPVIQGGKYDLSMHQVGDEEDKYIMRLTINKINDMDVGDYYCHAENAFGSATQPVSVRIRNPASVSDVKACCAEQNVTEPCMDACSFHLDMDAVIDKPECVPDFDKLMRCAADGSDHRSCCAHHNVPRRCLDWCRGEPVLNNKICVLSYTKQIMACFHEGREFSEGRTDVQDEQRSGRPSVSDEVVAKIERILLEDRGVSLRELADQVPDVCEKLCYHEVCARGTLPGPPQNVKIEYIDSHSVYVIWDPPIKNPHTVELYRVFWRLVDGSTDKLRHKGDTAETRLRISELKAFVKAGNSKGTSQETPALRFTMGGNGVRGAVISSAARDEGGSAAGGVAAAVLAAIGVLAAVAAAGVWFAKTRRFSNPDGLLQNAHTFKIDPVSVDIKMELH